MSQEHAHIRCAPRPTSGRYTFRALAASARCHSGGARRCRQPAAPQRWSMPRGVARHTPILPAMCCRARERVGRLSGRLPIFRSRSLAGGRGSQRHRGGAGPSATTAVVAAPWVRSPSATGSLKPPSPKKSRLNPRQRGRGCYHHKMPWRRRPNSNSDTVGRG